MAQNRTVTQKAAMIEALIKSLGVVTTACKNTGVSRKTHYQWMKEDEDYKSEVEDIENVALDFAESKLHKQIEVGNTAAIIYYLKTKGKKRGYIEKQEIGVESSGLTVQLNITKEDQESDPIE